MFSFYFIIPALCIILSSWLAVKAVKGGTSKKKAVVLQMVSVAAVMLCCLIIPARAAETSSGEMASTSTSQSSEDGAARANAFGIGLIAAALVTGLSGIGGGIAVASAAPAAIAATSEDPKAFGEGIALYGLLISIMIFSQLGQLKV